MKLNVEKEELVSIWSDVIESLDIMRAFQNGEVRSVDAKRLGHKGCLKLGRARNKLKNLIGNAFVPSS